MRVRGIVASAVLAALLGTGPAPAQTLFRPVAVVNDQAITGYDLAQRAQILVALGYPSASPDALRSAALDQLVDEKLKLQAAQKIGVSVTPEMVESAIEQFARRAGTAPDAFRAVLNAQGVTDQALEDMARAEVGWMQVVRARFADRVEPGEAEIQSELTLQGARAGAEYRVLEIGLPLAGEGRSAAETRALADELYAVLNAGGSFEEAVARYSEAPSAARGGEVGWITPERMPPELRRELDALEVGRVSRPLPVSGGLTILKLIDRRSGGAQPQLDDTARQAVRNQLVNERGARMAEGLLQEMRREALIEVR